jgi:hypothetical protein
MVASYVASKTFLALEGVFQSASKIRAWFKLCARVVCKAGATLRSVLSVLPFRPLACSFLCHARL